MADQGPGAPKEVGAGQPIAVATTQRQENPYATMLAVLGGGVAMALVILAIGVAVNRGSDESEAEATGGAQVPISMTEFAFSGSMAVDPGGTLAVTNDGSQVHNLVIDGGGRTSDLNSGESENLVVDLDEGLYEMYCDISGHREAGMESTLEVVAGGSGSNGDTEVAAGGHANHGADMTPAEAAEMDQVMIDSFQPFVDMVTSGEPNTEGLGGKELEPTILPDGTKEWTLTAEIVEWELEPGKFVEAWTYNGTTPGPTLRGEVGDNIRVRVINNLPLSTDVHMHGMILPNDQDGVAPLTQDLIRPGEEYVYEYEVTKPAIAMYHPHVHGQEKIPNGMWGAMIFSPEGGGGSGDYSVPRGRTISGVEIPADLEIAHEENMVLNDAGTIGLSLNGKSFPATEPYSMEQGEWMLVHYYNEGLQVHPMHLHQFPQLVVARDGIPLDSPYFADTVNVAPGERYTVLFQADAPGVWVWHCHVITHAESSDGMFGMVTAVAVS